MKKRKSLLLLAQATDAGLTKYTTIVFWALRTNYSMFTCMYVCEYVHTHIFTYIRTHVSSQRPPLTEMEIIRVIALFIWQRVMAATVAASRNEAVFNTLLRQHTFCQFKLYSFIDSNVVKCVEFVSQV